MKPLPNDWRDRLPEPASYYGSKVQRLKGPNSSGWAQGQCPLHEDGSASLSVHLSHPRGAYKCFAGCGEGDMVKFHMALTGLPFKDAAHALLRGDF